jgi:uncharacterized phage protein (TIGR01671 family)
MIKSYRAKEENTGEWVYGYYTLYPKCCGLHPCILTEIESGCIIPKFIDLTTLGSCTDMIDANDKEMFEGDVLKISSPNPNYNYLTVIYHKFCTLCINVPKEGSNVCAIGLAQSVWNEYECTVEVIGNIYDNPELLGDEENDNNDT